MSRSDAGKRLPLAGPAAHDERHALRVVPLQRIGNRLHFIEKPVVFRKARNAELEETRLPRAEYFTGPPLAEIFLRDEEAVVALAHDLQPRAPLGAERRLVKQHAVGSR